MTDTVLYRLAGCAAMFAGVLRTVASFVPAAALPTAALEWFYLAIDVAIVFALVGLYAYQRAGSGITGLIGFILALAGTESIGGPDGTIGDIDIYRAGTAVIGLGMLLFAAGSIKAGKLPLYVPVLWIVSTLAGIGSFAAPGSTLPFLLAGAAFGLGFAGAGWHLVTRPARGP